MIFHAKALEMLTEGYQCLLDIDTANDLEVLAFSSKATKKVSQKSNFVNILFFL
jgi:hypothetical protein